MFNIGDVVSYGSSGVCRITGDCEQKVKGEKKKYLILKPVYQNNSTVYLPLDNEMLVERMKRLLTADEIEDIIKEMPDSKSLWIENDNKRTEAYTEIMKNGDRGEILRMLRTLYKHRQKMFDKGRKLHASDDYIMKSAEELVFNEFALVLGIKPEEVLGFIEEKIGE